MTIEPKHPNSPAATHPIAPTHQPGGKRPIHQAPHSPSTPPAKEPQEVPAHVPTQGIGKPFPGVVDPAPHGSPPVGPITVR